MSVAVLPYSVEYYNTLPHIEDAGLKFDVSSARGMLESDLSSIFLKHGVENKFGISLLHQHFALEDHEKLVAIGDVAVPWNYTEGGFETAYIQPSSWRFVGNSGSVAMTPYEFVHSLEILPQPTDAGIMLFFADIKAALDAWGLTGLLGVCAIRGMALDSLPIIEFTSGRANISLPFDLHPVTDSTIEAMWIFKQPAVRTNDPTIGKPYARSQCKLRCKRTNAGHGKRHLDT